LTADHSLSKGFRIEDPEVLIAWGSPVAEVLEAFATKGAAEPRQVTPLYYTAPCTILGGLRCEVGFHFEGKGSSSSLKKIELFGNGERNIETSYRVFQDRLLKHFGSPTIEKAGTLGVSMPDCRWRVGSVAILHYAMDRFGPEEHLWIEKQPAFSVGPNGVIAIVVSLVILALLSYLGLL
jgi:hypothetical protein